MLRRFNQKDVAPFVTAVGITAVSFLGIHFFGNQFVGVMWAILGVLLVILLGIIAMWAGILVVRSLFVVAGELSLLIFLAQSYCNVPGRSTPGNEALKSLLIVGLLYIGFLFLNSLLKALKETYNKMERDESTKEKIFVITVFLLFSALFVWEVYLVIGPIIRNLC